MDPSKRVSARTYVANAYRSFIDDSFYRNSTYLLVNMGVSTIAGFVFVVLCAHLFSQASFGYATALLGALSLSTALANVGMNRTVVRFMGRSETRSQDLITSVALVSAAATLTGVVLSFFLSSFGIKHVNALVVVVFIATVFLASVRPLFDNVFLALRQSSGILIENSVYSFTRLLFPLLVVGSGYLGIFSSQLAAVVVSLSVCVVLLRRRHDVDFFVKPSRASLEGKWRFAMGSYSSDLVGGLPASVLPIIVVARLGPVSGALWYVAMQMINVLLTVSAQVSNAMFAEMASAQGHLGAVLKKASIAMYGLMIPLSVAVFVAAPDLLRLLHGDYVAAEHVLRLMTIFALIGVANYITGNILQIYKKVLYLTFVNVANAVVVILYALFVATNLNGIAIGWMYGEVVNLVLFVLGGVVVARRYRLNMDFD